MARKERPKERGVEGLVVVLVESFGFLKSLGFGVKIRRSKRG